MALFNGVFRKRPNSLCTAFLTNQLNPIIISKKSSKRRVIPLPKDALPVSPILISGLKSIENIKIYSPHSNLTNETTKMPKANVTQIKISGGYCEIKNPTRRAMIRKETNKICGRTDNSRFSCY